MMPGLSISDDDGEGTAACLRAGLRLVAGRRLIAGRRLFAGMRRVADRSLKEQDSQEEGIKSGLHCFSPLLVQQLLVVSQIGHHRTPQ